MTETTSTSREKLALLTDNIGTIIRGKQQEIRYVITALLARGHILLEDNPGAGKTQMAKTLAQSISGGLKDEAPLAQRGTVAFPRIQLTPDLLPMDLKFAYIN
jgi:MoxR-like ATPase